MRHGLRGCGWLLVAALAVAACDGGAPTVEVGPIPTAVPTSTPTLIPKQTPVPTATPFPTPTATPTAPAVTATPTAPAVTATPTAGGVPGFSLSPAFPGLQLPGTVHLTHSGDGTDRLWAVLQHGEIEVFDNDPAAPNPRTFLDVSSAVYDGGSEEGLLGLAFAPDYGTSGTFYVYYTRNGPRRSVISRFSVSPDPDLADASSEEVILEVPQPYANHNGGTLAFGPDGMLYVGLGDGGSGGDPQGNGQDLTTLLGSILRLDVSGDGYAIPADNPFADASSADQRLVWAYGLRNPWKFSFDPATGDLWAGDVGQSRLEEVNLIVRGGNYGWNVMEGTSCYNASTCASDGFVDPIFEYGHDEGCSITGGQVYRGSRLPSLVGAYVYGDYCSGRIWALRYDGGSVTDHVMLVDASFRIPSFGVDEAGEVYMVGSDGRVYALVQ